MQSSYCTGVTPETVTTGDVNCTTPQDIQAAQMRATHCKLRCTSRSCTGQVSDDAIAQAAGVERIATIEAAECRIFRGALTERVIGTLSEG